ncbi:MAG: DUF4214 domain-containing protein [Lachnospiraceae bacterium]
MENKKRVLSRTTSVFLFCLFFFCLSANISYAMDTPVDSNTELFLEENELHNENTTGTCGDDLTWSLDATGKLTISGNGYIAQESFMGNEEIRSIEITSGISGIGERAFKNCVNLVDVDFPNSLHSISTEAFRNTSLTSVDLRDIYLQYNVFSDCRDLQRVTISTSVISAGTFSNCYNLTDLTIESGVGKIEPGAFYGCSSLEQIIIPSSVYNISNSVFEACTNLVSITIPNSVGWIGADCFKGCDNLTVYCNVGSTAEQYSVKNGIHYVLLDSREVKVNQFVSRMYTVVLNREPEKEGLEYWCKELLAQKQDGAALANGFINSAEFKIRGLSDSEYLDVLYSTFFDRTADDSGKEYWLTEMRMGMSKNTVLSEFVNSKEFGVICSNYGIARGTMEKDGTSIFNAGVYNFVLRNYTKALGREGDVEGIEYWTYLINTKQSSALSVAESFFQSEEFKSKNFNNSQYVDVLYQTFFDRYADEDGKSYWMVMMALGKSRDWVLSEFSNSSEFKTIMAQYGL